MPYRPDDLTLDEFRDAVSGEEPNGGAGLGVSDTGIVAIVAGDNERLHTEYFAYRAEPKTGRIAAITQRSSVSKMAAVSAIVTAVLITGSISVVTAAVNPETQLGHAAAGFINDTVMRDGYGFGFGSAPTTTGASPSEGGGATGSDGDGGGQSEGGSSSGDGSSGGSSKSSDGSAGNGSGGTGKSSGDGNGSAGKADGSNNSNSSKDSGKSNGSSSSNNSGSNGSGNSSSTKADEKQSAADQKAAEKAARDATAAAAAAQRAAERKAADDAAAAAQKAAADAAAAAAKQAQEAAAAAARCPTGQISGSVTSAEGRASHGAGFGRVTGSVTNNTNGTVTFNGSNVVQAVLSGPGFSDSKRASWGGRNGQFNLSPGQSLSWSADWATLHDARSGSYVASGDMSRLSGVTWTESKFRSCGAPSIGGGGQASFTVS